MRGIFLLLGSNLGERHLIMEDAVKSLEEKAGHIKAISDLYETEAWGLEGQPDYLNQAVELDTKLSPEQLLTTINQIERDLGRKRFKKWDSRLIDIDILFYNDQIIQSKNLTIPHPEFKKRNFALIPMNEIAAEEKYPGEDVSIKDLVDNCPDKLEVKKYFP